MTLSLAGVALTMALAALVGVPGALLLHVVADLALLAYVATLRVGAVRTQRRREEAREQRLLAARAAAAAPVRRRNDLESWLPRRLPSRAVLENAPRPGSKHDQAVSAARVASPVPVAPVPVASVPAAPVPTAPVPTAPVPVPAESVPVRRRTIPVVEFEDTPGNQWSPVPVPPPVYTTKPRAPERPAARERVLDLTVPGAWTAANVLADLEGQVDEMDDTIELDAIIEERWAVND